MNRREFLLGAIAGGVLAVAPSSRAIGPAQRFRVLRVRYRGKWDRNIDASSVLAEQLRLRTSIDATIDAPHGSLTSPAFRGQSFAVLAGDGAFELDSAERSFLKRWLELGGFLLVDNAGRPEASRAFDESVRTQFAAIFPRRAFQRVSPEHVLFRSFYRLDYPAGRAIHKPFVEGLRIGPRYAVALNHNDLMGALSRTPEGIYRFVPVPGAENQREMAIRFGINLVMYSLCLHYKDDQVHLDHLLRRRKWRIKPPKR